MSNTRVVALDVCAWIMPSHEPALMCNMTMYLLKGLLIPTKLIFYECSKYVTYKMNDSDHQSETHGDERLILDW